MATLPDIKATTEAIQAATNEYQAATAAQDWAGARAARGRLTELQGRRVTFAPLLEGTSASTVAYTERRRGSERTSASYLPVEVVETRDGYAKYYRGVRLVAENDAGYRQAVYNKKVEYYDAGGRLVKVETYDVFERESGGGQTAYLSEVVTYENGVKATGRVTVRDAQGVRSQRDIDYRTGATTSERRPSTNAPTTTIYTVRNPLTGNLLQSPSLAWLEQKTGRKIYTEPGAFSLTDEGGRQYGAREYTIGGKPVVIGLRSVSEAEQSARAPVLSSVGFPPSATTTVDTSSALAVSASKPLFELAGPLPAPVGVPKMAGTRTDLATADLRLPGEEKGTLTAATINRGVSSFYSDVARTTGEQLAAGKLSAAGPLFVATAAGVGLGAVEFGKTLVTNPGAFLAAPVLIAANPGAALESARENPLGLVGQLAAGGVVSWGVGALVGPKVAAYRATQAEKALSTTELGGVSRTVNREAVFTEKSGASDLTIAGRKFRVESQATESGGVLSEKHGLLAQNDALLLARGLAADEAMGGLAGGGTARFAVLEGKKVLATGEVVSQLGSVGVGDTEVFARINRATSIVAKTGKATRSLNLEVGTLTPELAVEEFLQPTGARLGELASPEGFTLKRQLTEGRSVVIKEAGLSAKHIRIEDVSRSFTTKKPTVEKIKILDLAAGRKPSVLEGPTIIGSEARTVDVSRFLTTETEGPVPKLSLPKNPLEETPEFAFRQLFGEKEPTMWSLRRSLTDINPRLVGGAGVAEEQLTAASRPGLRSFSETARKAEASQLLKAYENRQLSAAALGAGLRDLGITPTAATFGKVTNAELRLQSTALNSGPQAADLASPFRDIFASETPRKAFPGLLANEATTTPRTTSGLKSSLPGQQGAKIDLAPRSPGAPSLTQRPLIKALRREETYTAARLEGALQTKTKAAERTISRIGARTELRLGQETGASLRVGQETGTRLSEALATRVSQRTGLSLKTGLLATQRGMTTTTPPPPPLIRIPKLTGLVTQNGGGVPGFDVFLRRKGVFQKLNPEPLARGEALLQGLKAADVTAGATVKLKEAGASAKLGTAPSGAALSGALRKFSARKGGLFVEKNKARIDTGGEYGEITVKGLAALAIKRRRK